MNWTGLTDYAKVERIYKQQSLVVTELKKHMEDRIRHAEGLEKKESLKEELKKTHITKADLADVDDLIEKMKNRIAEIEDLQKAANRINDQVYPLLLFRSSTFTMLTIY